MLYDICFLLCCGYYYNVAIITYLTSCLLLHPCHNSYGYYYRGLYYMAAKITPGLLFMWLLFLWLLFVWLLWDGGCRRMSHNVHLDLPNVLFKYIFPFGLPYGVLSRFWVLWLTSLGLIDSISFSIYSVSV